MPWHARFELVATARMLLRPVMAFMKGWLRRLLFLTGGCAALLLIGACTRTPYDLHRWLGRGAGECACRPDAMVILGGSGMPSGPELLRLHRAAAMANQAGTSLLYVIHPDTGSTMEQMVDELVLRGVARHRIIPIPFGENTREQALVFVKVKSVRYNCLALVTAPENMYRSLRTFQRAGVGAVCGAPAWEHAMDHDFDYGHKAIGGKSWAPDVSGSTGLRYTFWNYLKLEITCLRELTALAYYRVNGWI